MYITSQDWLVGSEVEHSRTPNNSGKMTQPVRFIIVHYTGGVSRISSANWMSRKKSRVSCHLVIGRDEKITQLLPFSKVAWHAGKSRWGQYTGLNHCSIGVEFDNVGPMVKDGDVFRPAAGYLQQYEYSADDVVECDHPQYQYWHKYTDWQINWFVAIRDLLFWAYGQNRIIEVLGHSEIAPKRKIDPGPAFPIDQVR